MPIAADPTNPLLQDQALMDRLERIWQDDQRAKEHVKRRRRKRGLGRLWDGDMNYRGRVTAEDRGSVRWVMNNTGTATLRLPMSHYLTKWAVNRGAGRRRTCTSRSTRTVPVGVVGALATPR
ncbi:hypothetical protein GS491_23795 [Rhodococcus hoagii]|nr:hypothetical protein [Prescottella equi]